MTDQKKAQTPQAEKAPHLQEIADSDLDKVQGGKKATLAGDEIGKPTTQTDMGPMPGR